MYFTGKHDMKNSRKYIILLGDGMADLPLDELGGRTVLEAARTPNMDFMAQNGLNGMTRTVPPGMNPGSDTANLSVFGYDPQKYYSGRAPLEAINMDIVLEPGDVAFRCNIVNAAGGLMNDFTSDHIDSRLTRIVINEIARSIKEPGIEFYPGVSYRNIMVWRDFPGNELPATTPPHDIQGEQTAPHLPSGNGSELLRRMMHQSKSVIADSTEIRKALGNFQGTPESIWLWGCGFRPAIDTLESRFGISGRTISAVDLIHGIGKAAGLKPLDVPGATGYLDTDYEGKVKALLNSIGSCDYVFLHVEAPDESGHEGNLEHKTKAIEDFDSRVVGPVLEGLKKFNDYVILLMPDHPTPLEVRTHTSDPVPFCIMAGGNLFAEERKKYNASAYNEKCAAGTGLYIDEAHKLIEIMIRGTII